VYEPTPILHVSEPTPIHAVPQNVIEKDLGEMIIDSFRSVRSFFSPARNDDHRFDA
jgi:hypothetical protein